MFVRGKFILLYVIIITFLTSGCAPTPNQLALKIGGLPQDAVKTRAIQIRRYDVSNQVTALSAATQTLMDLGYTISESSPDLGVIVASKTRDAHEVGQMIFAILFGGANAIYDSDQTIKVMVVSTPASNGNQTDIRVSFSREVRTNREGLFHSELVSAPEIYTEFFNKFSSAIALEGHQI